MGKEKEQGLNYADVEHLKRQTQELLRFQNIDSSSKANVVWMRIGIPCIALYQLLDAEMQKVRANLGRGWDAKKIKVTTQNLYKKMISNIKSLEQKMQDDENARNEPAYILSITNDHAAESNLTPYEMKVLKEAADFARTIIAKCDVTKVQDDKPFTETRPNEDLYEQGHILKFSGNGKGPSAGRE